MYITVPSHTSWNFSFALFDQWKKDKLMLGQSTRPENTSRGSLPALHANFLFHFYRTCKWTSPYKTMKIGACRLTPIMGKF